MGIEKAAAPRLAAIARRPRTKWRFRMQDSARVATRPAPEANRPTPSQQLAAFTPHVAPTADTFRCADCNRTLPTALIAFERENGEGVCLTCDTEFAEAMAMPA